MPSTSRTTYKSTSKSTSKNTSKSTTTTFNTSKSTTTSYTTTYGTSRGTSRTTTYSTSYNTSRTTTYNTSWSVSTSHQTTASTTSSWNTTYYTTFSSNTTLYTNTNTTVNTPLTPYQVTTSQSVLRSTNFFRPKEVSQTNLMLNLDARVSAGSVTWKDQSSNNRNATISGTMGISNRCVALYNFHSNATDLTGNNTGTETAITYGGGNFGQGAVFNGSSSRIDLPVGLGTTGARSNSLWIKVNTFPSSGIDTFLYIGTQNANQNYETISITSTSKVKFQQRVGSSTDMTAIESSETIIAGNWYHITTTHDGTTAKLYINGDLSKGGSVSFSSYVNNLSLVGNLGAFRALTPSYDGSIDQYRRFNKALSSSEVTQLYNESSSTFKKVDIFNDALIGHYDLDSTDSFNIPQFITDQNFTIGGWFYRDTAAAATLWAQGYAPSVRCQLTGPSEISIYIHNGSSGASYNIGVNAPVGEWFHLMKTYDLSAGTVKVYLNSALKKTQTVMTGNIYSSGNSDAFFRISKNSSNNNGYLDGKISQVRVYDSVLTDAQIVDDYSTHDYLYI